MKWPFVSRRAYDLLYETYERVIRDRDADRERGDRALDQLVNHVGFQPVSAPVRAEFKEAAAEYVKSLDLPDNQFDDQYGMIAEDLLAQEPS